MTYRRSACALLATIGLLTADESSMKKLWQRLGSGAHTDIDYPEIWLFMCQLLATLT